MAKKAATAVSGGGRPGNVGSDVAQQKKMSVVTILRRPQDKESAVRNMATITGRPIEVIAMQMFQSTRVVRQPFDDIAAAAENAGVGSEAKKAESEREEGGPDRLRPGNVGAGAAKKVGKKKTTPVREAASRKAGVPVPRAATEAVCAKVRRLGALDGGDTHARAQSAPIHARPVERDARRALEVEEKKDRTPVARRTVSNVEGLVCREAPDVVSPRGESLSVSSNASGPGNEERVAAADEKRHAKAVRNGVSQESGSDEEQLLTSCSPPKPSERWAGPAYTNSPPPSTLPFPNFSIHRVKSSLTAATLPEIAPCRSVPALPPRRCSSWLLSSAMDPSSATKDLKKILNLDVEATEKERHVFGSRDYLRDSPTRSLKRLLQLQS